MVPFSRPSEATERDSVENGEPERDGGKACGPIIQHNRKKPWNIETCQRTKLLGLEPHPGDFNKGVSSNSRKVNQDHTD